MKGGGGITVEHTLSAVQVGESSVQRLDGHVDDTLVKVFAPPLAIGRAKAIGDLYMLCQ